MRIGWKPKSQDPNVASVRFRYLTPLTELQRTGFGVEPYDAAHEAEYELVVFSKLYGEQELETAGRLRSAGIRTALDLSDNHFYNPHGLPLYAKAAADLAAMAEAVDQVICCSPSLASAVTAQAKLRRRPLVVGDAVEDFALPLTAQDPFDAPADGVFRILWFGSHGSPNAPSGVEDLLRIRPHLEHAAAARPCELVVLSNNRERSESVTARMAISSRYVEWTHGAFAAELARTNLVVIPITLNPFTKCKSANRLATALWYGVPAIADRIPAYDELSGFCHLGSWEAGFQHALAQSRDLRLRTLAGSSYVRARFNTRVIAGEWRRAFKGIVASVRVARPVA